MKCLVCEEFSLQLICKRCQDEFLQPNLFKRRLACGLNVYSFYKFSEIEDLIKSKYTIYGGAIYKILAFNSFTKYIEEFKYNSLVYAIPIDDRPTPYFSHSAILARSLKTKFIIPKYAKLRAKNRVSYAGKPLSFRLQNPRNFCYNFKRNIEVILVDDVVTTGVTLSEAYSLLIQNSVKVIFALTLADLNSDTK